MVIILTEQMIITGVVVFISAILLYDLAKSFFTKGAGKMIWDTIRLKLWYVGGMHKKILNKQLAELFIPLFQSGIPIADVFQLIGNAVQNKIYADRIRAIGIRVERGEKVSEAISENPYFSAELTTLFNVQEISGEFDKNLDYFIERTEQEYQLSLKTALYVAHFIYMVVLVQLIEWMRNTFN